MFDKVAENRMMIGLPKSIGWVIGSLEGSRRDVTSYLGDFK